MIFRKMMGKANGYKKRIKNNKKKGWSWCNFGKVAKAKALGPNRERSIVSNGVKSFGNIASREIADEVIIV